VPTLLVSSVSWAHLMCCVIIAKIEQEVNKNSAGALGVTRNQPQTLSRAKLLLSKGMLFLKCQVIVPYPVSAARAKLLLSKGILSSKMPSHCPLSSICCNSLVHQRRVKSYNSRERESYGVPPGTGSLLTPASLACANAVCNA